MILFFFKLLLVYVILLVVTIPCFFAANQLIEDRKFSIQVYKNVVVKFGGMVLLVYFVVHLVIEAFS